MGLDSKRGRSVSSRLRKLPSEGVFGVIVSCGVLLAVQTFRYALLFDSSESTEPQLEEWQTLSRKRLSRKIFRGSSSNFSTRAFQPHDFTFHSIGPNGLSLAPIIDFVNRSYFEFEAVESTWYLRTFGPFPAFLAAIDGAPKIWIPENVINRRNIHHIKKVRLGGILPHFQRALATTLFEHQERFPEIHEILNHGIVFPIIFQLDDFRGCLEHGYNWTTKSGETVVDTLPIMSFARQENCSYAFPIPSYKHFEYIELGHKSWENKFIEWESRYGNLTQKIPKAIWRGQCSSGGSHHRHIFITKSNFLNNQRFIDARPYNDEACPWNLKGEKYLAKRMATEDSMLYRAVLDIDGNSWSERFSRLLCYNSVVIKVGVFPDHDEYFMPSLIPGKHYVSADLRNFTQVAKLTVSNKSLSAMQTIVQNANTWCKTFMTYEEAQLDFLTVLNSIIKGVKDYNLAWKEDLQSVPFFVGAASFRGHGGFISSLNDSEFKRDSLLVVSG